jgi:hypothetical protein
MTGKAEGRGIPIIDRAVPYKVFLDEYLRPLEPCIVSGLTREWAAAKEWTTLDTATDNLIPNFCVLDEVFGQYTGCVTFCAETDSDGDAIQRSMSVSNFIQNILSSSVHDYLNSTRKTYLKDFHFMRLNPSVKQPYVVPKFFQGSDLLYLH